eukprot:CAMPEP_0177689178 /NCGR_PEP_ID=MMETSP0484_2-20121128/27_1 /TAXON_ID=354590 /ORGANISM="Rhodomonas lens, Strain RHODO" /LENGTH=96 /DNA_ID=CAMNT_0019199503 /DNA_START=52 /DNA_END=342 /DNA_ORIENTATION=+
MVLKRVSPTPAISGMWIVCGTAVQTLRQVCEKAPIPHTCLCVHNHRGARETASTWASSSSERAAMLAMARLSSATSCSRQHRIRSQSRLPARDATN